MKKNVPLVMEMLRNWYFIDSVLLNDHAKHAITEHADYDEYVSLKAALMSDLQEFYNHIGYKPQHKNISNHRKLQEHARNLAVEAKSISARMLENADMMNHMKKIIKEKFELNKSSDFSSISDRVINERFTKMCLDNVLVGKPILTCENEEKASDFKAQILEQGYLTIRSDMIRIAEKYNNSFSRKVLNEVSLAAAGLALIGGFMVAGAAKRTIEAFSNRCESRCGAMRINASAKKGCVLKCKIQTHQKIIAALRQSASQTNNVQARNKFAKDVKRAQLRMTQYQRQLAKLNASRAGSDSMDPSDRGRII